MLLDPMVQGEMERAFAANFSDVTVQMAPELRGRGMLALADGRDLYFAPGFTLQTTRDQSRNRCGNRQEGFCAK